MTDFDPGELETWLTANLPSGWAGAVRSGDEAGVFALKATLDNPAFVRLLGAEGWVAPHWDARFGGRGLTIPDAQAALTLLDTWEVPRVPRGSGLPLAAPTILEWATDDVKERFLPRIASGEERWCQLFSEPGAGSDMASLATSAVRDGDEWVVNGQKVWTTMGHQAEFGMLLARTDPSQPKHKGITYFGLDMRAPGVEVRQLVNMAGQVEFNEVFMTDVRVPDRYRISPVGEGWGASLTTLGAERLTLSGARRKRKAKDEILGGKTFDEIRSLLDSPVDQLTRQSVMNEWAKQRVLQWTTQRSRVLGGAAGSLTKISKAAGNQSLQLLAMHLLGARAMAWEVDDETTADFVRQFLRTRANSIEGGTSEIQRNIVGERVLGLPREPDAFHGLPWNQVPRS